jgi:hypothetical protein
MDFNPVSMFETAVKVVKENKMLDIMKTILIITLLLYIGYHVNDLPDIVRHAFESRNTELQMEHDSAVERRRVIKPQVDLVLAETMATLRADSVYVIEMHNGTNNTAGLPFIYGEMTYEMARDGIEHIDEDYVSVNLSRFEFPMFLEENHMFFGDIEALSKIDEKLAMRMSANGVTFIAITSMHGANNELGYFGISYCGSEPVEPRLVVSTITVASQKLSAMLDIPEAEFN